METFGNKLKELRIEKELTQKELADIFQVAKATIGFWENDKIEPNNQMLVKIANYFDVTTDYLLGREELTDLPIVARGGEMQYIKANKEELRRDLEELEKVSQDAIEKLRKKLGE